MLYVDTNILIYFLEGGVHSKRIADILTTNQSEGGYLLCSALGITEFLSGTNSKNAKEVLYSTPLLTFTDISTNLAETAAGLQKKHQLKIGDALHLSTAVEQGCKSFFTNDLKLAKVASKYLNVIDLQ